MVKKLLKHEMIAYSRTMLVIEAIVLGFAIIARCIWAFETDSITYDIVNVSSIRAFVISIIVCLVFIKPCYSDNNCENQADYNRNNKGYNGGCINYIIGD